MHHPFEASPLSPGAIIRHTWNLYRRHWRAWLGLSLVTYVPLVLANQILNLAVENGDASAAGSLLTTLAACWQALLMSGVGAILVADSVRGERPSVWYALDLLFTQRLGRTLLTWLCVVIVTDLVSLPLILLQVLNLLPYETAIVLVNTLPWIAAIGLLLAALALIATRRQPQIPLLLVVGFVVAYSLVLIGAPDQPTTFQQAIDVFSQGTRQVVTAALLLLMPAVVLDPAPVRQAAARGWTIAKQNLPLIFFVVFLIGLVSSFVELALQGVAYALPGMLTSNAPIDLGLWLVGPNYVNALIYYIPLSLVFVAAVFTPLQAIFAAVVTLDGYWQFEEEVAPDSNPAISAAEPGPDAETDALSTEEVAKVAPRPLVTYADLALFAILIAASTVLSYGSGVLREAFVAWINQFLS